MTVHPLQAVREDQAQKKHNRDLGGLIRQAIVDHIKTTGECHVDDLIPLYPKGEVDLCRHLATAQFGSLARHKLIRKDGWRRTQTEKRKGGGGWVWKFTKAGQAKYGIAGVEGTGNEGPSPLDPGDSPSGAGVPQPQGEGGSPLPTRDCASTGAPEVLDLFTDADMRHPRAA